MEFNKSLCKIHARCACQDHIVHAFCSYDPVCYGTPHNMFEHRHVVLMAAEIRGKIDTSQKQRMRYIIHLLFSMICYCNKTNINFDLKDIMKVKSIQGLTVETLVILSNKKWNFAFVFVALYLVLQ